LNIEMKVSIAFLGSAIAVTALRAPRNPGEKKSHAINPKDFVYVDGLRLKDAKGLHYITVRIRPSQLISH
jgi:mannan endo-1,4-beta-mannosidase